MLIHRKCKSRIALEVSPCNPTTASRFRNFHYVPRQVGRAVCEHRATLSIADQRWQVKMLRREIRWPGWKCRRGICGKADWTANVLSSRHPKRVERKWAGTCTGFWLGMEEAAPLI